MKVVLFCGGLGTRLRDYSESVPKPMVNIGYRPILWNLMKYYSYYGHKDFILCLGYKADFIKNYFLNYNECLSNDFVLSGGGKQLLMLNSDIQDWKITFVDTGLHSNIGQRLKAVEKHLAGEEMFLANYSDGLTDLPLNNYIDNFIRQDKIASFVSVRPNQTFHIVSTKNNSIVTDISHINYADIRINGGFFAFKTEIFKYIGEGEELVIEPFQRLIDKQELIAYQYDGFWACMDTFKDKQTFDDMYAQGKPIWEVWKTSNPSLSPPSDRSDTFQESITLKELVKLNEET
ncbi:MAG: glucose-1-phosphate cytidylyltransferase [Acaryochloris sp. RU_4_1]|nr:glucose-1-phosphate cytidylyltransferase [Acaryochloris sp. RU_4_1]NJR53515.1 glucose-1-phosphate cytidylyltransferase [Acaryochloris sp. CRU_2_0]